MIRIWRGFHSKELLGLIQQSWKNDELLILCPPGLKDFSFLEFLPAGEVKMAGDWSGAAIQPLPEQLSENRKTHKARYPSNPILGVFTSGTSSGAPRLVLYSKENLEFALNGIRSFFDTDRFDTLFCYPQPFHTFGLVLGYVHAALHGLELVTGEGRYSQNFHRQRVALRKSSVLTLGAPTHFHDLLSFTRSQNVTLEPSYSCIVGGAKVFVSLWHEIRDTLKVEAPSIGYGATEASPGVTHQNPGQAPLEAGEIGTVIPGISTRIFPGEGLEFSGPNVCLAIVHEGKIEFPQQILLRDDIRARSDGVLIYAGRTDLVLNRGGQKFSLEGMEEKIRKEVGIEALCVIVPHERLGEELGILVQGPPVLERKMNIYSFLQKEFGQAFDRRQFIAVERFPLNESLKVDRKRGTQLLLELRDF